LAESYVNAHRLHTLATLASAPARSNRAVKMANQAFAALEVQACIIHQFRAPGDAEVVATNCRPGIDPDALSQLASRLAVAIATSRQFLINNDLRQDNAEDPLVAAGVITSYLGVPLFGSTGAVMAVVAIFADPARPFDKEDHWWLETSAHLLSASIACETLEERLCELERATAEESTDAEPKIAPVSSGAPARSLSILVVDDDRSVSNLLKRFLTRRNFQVDCAGDGLEAMRMFSPDIHDVVISDMVMPGMNGWELVANLRRALAKVPMVMITGYSSNNNGVWNRSFLKEQGIVAVLNKPLDFEHLCSVLDDISAKQRSSAGDARPARPVNQ